MKYFFCTNIQIDLNNKHRTCETSLRGGLKENVAILLLLLDMGAAPSSGSLLDNAKALNLMKLLLMEYDLLCFVDCMDHLNL